MPFQTLVWICSNRNDVAGVSVTAASRSVADPARSGGVFSPEMNGSIDRYRKPFSRSFLAASPRFARTFCTIVLPSPTSVARNSSPCSSADRAHQHSRRSIWFEASIGIRSEMACECFMTWSCSCARAVNLAAINKHDRPTNGTLVQ